MRNYNKRKKATATKWRNHAATPGSDILMTTECDVDATIEHDHNDSMDIEVDTECSDSIEKKAKTTDQHATVSVQKNDTNVNWTSDDQVDYEIDDEEDHEAEKDDALDTSTPITYYIV